MRYIDHIAHPEPKFFADFKKRNGPRKDGSKKKNVVRTYDDLSKTEEGCEVRRDLREYLAESQNGLCAYCCASIDGSKDKTSTEHIAPGRDKSSSLEYDNMVASCRNPRTCTSAKGCQYNPSLFVSPLDPDCAMHFKFRTNGEIVGTTDKGKYTCELLNLNDFELQQARRDYYFAYRYYGESSIRNKIESPGSFPFSDMWEYFLREG